MELELRPLQRQAIVDLRESWKDHRTHLINAPCGFGKTALAAHIVNGFCQAGKRVLFCAPYTVLIEQTVERFVSFGLPQPGVIWQKHELTDPLNPIQIASTDTLIRREFPECDVLIVDECHLRRTKLLEIISEISIPVIGLSATPYAGWMGNYYESLIKTKTTREMIEEGYLSDYEMYGAPNAVDLKGVKVKNYAHGRDYDEKALGDAMADKVLVGDIVENWLKKGENEPTISFCVNVMHANAVTIDFQKAGVAAEVITAKTPMPDRQAMFQRFRDGITKVIVSVSTLIAGFDEDVRCLIFARPTKSEMLYQQAVGRGLRLAKGKKRCIILEHSGTWENLGFPCEITIDELKTSTNGDETAKKEEAELKPEKKPKECPACKHIKKPGEYECPKCGFKPIVGEHVETTSDELKVIKRDKGKKVFTPAEKQQAYSEIYGYWQQKTKWEGKNWKEGWVANQYKARFGVWPKNMKKVASPPSPTTINFITSQWVAYSKRNRA